MSIFITESFIAISSNLMLNIGVAFFLHMLSRPISLILRDLFSTPYFQNFHVSMLNFCTKYCLQLKYFGLLNFNNHRRYIWRTTRLNTLSMCSKYWPTISSNNHKIKNLLPHFILKRCQLNTWRSIRCLKISSYFYWLYYLILLKITERRRSIWYQT